MSVPSLSGKTALVTGATNGIGKETALALARAGATVVIVGRNRALTEATAEEIRCATGNYQVDYLVADLSSRAETRRIAEEFLASERPLHILVNYGTTRINISKPSNQIFISYFKTLETSFIMKPLARTDYTD